MWLRLFVGFILAFFCSSLVALFFFNDDIEKIWFSNIEKEIIKTDSENDELYKLRFVHLQKIDSINNLISKDDAALQIAAYQDKIKFLDATIEKNNTLIDKHVSVLIIKSNQNINTNERLSLLHNVVLRNWTNRTMMCVILLMCIILELCPLLCTRLYDTSEYFKHCAIQNNKFNSKTPIYEIV